MKVGQVTYCGNNYGSVLQCFATQSELKKHGLECSLVTRSETRIGRIGQSLEFRLNMLWKFLRYPKHLQTFRECLQTLHPADTEDGLHKDAKQAIDAFIQAKIQRDPLSWKQMKKLAHSKDCGFFLSGSDQIWSAHWFITNRLWFLRFCPREKRVAWMPSFGGEKLAEYNRPTYAKYISEYACLSVREEAGSKILEDLLHISVPALADPVFLLDANTWRTVSAGESRKKPYLMMFFLDRPSPIAMKQAKLLQEATGWEIVYFSYHYHGNDGAFIAGGPEQFLHTIDNAQAVLTDSFHACSFSAIFHTPFYAFSRSSASGAKQMSRIKNLLNLLSMPERYIDSEDCCCNEVTPIPQIQVNRELESMRQRILAYLENVLQHYKGKEM